MATEKEVEQLAEAMWQILDDVGRGHASPCLAALAHARIAYEPFRDHSEPEYDDWLPLSEAQAIIVEADRN